MHERRDVCQTDAVERDSLGMGGHRSNGIFGPGASEARGNRQPNLVGGQQSKLADAIRHFELVGRIGS